MEKIVFGNHSSVAKVTKADPEQYLAKNPDGYYGIGGCRVPFKVAELYEGQKYEFDCAHPRSPRAGIRATARKRISAGLRSWTPDVRSQFPRTSSIVARCPSLPR